MCRSLQKPLHYPDKEPFQQCKCIHLLCLKQDQNFQDHLLLMMKDRSKLLRGRVLLPVGQIRKQSMFLRTRKPLNPIQPRPRASLQCSLQRYQDNQSKMCQSHDMFRGKDPLQLRCFDQWAYTIHRTTQRYILELIP